MLNKNSRIFLAGHNGLVGGAIFKRLINSGYKNIITVPKNKLDLRDQKKVFEDLTNELCELDDKFVCSGKNLMILKYVMRLFKHYGDISKFEIDVLYTPVSKIFHKHKEWITRG